MGCNRLRSGPSTQALDLPAVSTLYNLPSPAHNVTVPVLQFRQLAAACHACSVNERATALCCARYLTDHITQLPLGVMSRLLSAQDAVMALLPLVDAPPWVRDRAGGKVGNGSTGCWQQPVSLTASW